MLLVAERYVVEQNNVFRFYAEHYMEANQLNNGHFRRYLQNIRLYNCTYDMIRVARVAWKPTASTVIPRFFMNDAKYENCERRFSCITHKNYIIYERIHQFFNVCQQKNYINIFFKSLIKRDSKVIAI